MITSPEACSEQFHIFSITYFGSIKEAGKLVCAQVLIFNTVQYFKE